MAILNGFIDGSAVPQDILLTGLGVDSVLAVQNNGPNILHIIVGGKGEAILVNNTRVFFVPTGTKVEWGAPVTTGNWQLAVPG